jgi:CBS domain-containing protein
VTGQRVRDVMTPQVVVVAPDCGYKHVVDVMVDFKVSAVPVVEDGVVVGLVSEADLLHITIGPSESIGAAARMMEQHRVKRLPVVDESTGRLVGIVARRDLLRPYLRPDEEIKEDVATQVIRDALWIDPAGIDIAVNDGRVVLRGRVDRRTTAAIAVRLVQALAGVVSVDDELTWDFDDVAAGKRLP